MLMARWIGLAAAICIPAAAHAATYELGEPFHLACAGLLVSKNGSYELAGGVSESKDPEDDEVCERVIVAEKNGADALKYTLKDNEISRILKTCPVGRRCRIEGEVRNFSHGIFFFVKIDTISAK
jgi:hypothetical protein